jgi:hypothetical protein
MQQSWERGNRKRRKLKPQVVVAGYSFLAVIFIILVVIFSSGDGDPDIRMVSGTEYISGEQGQVIIRLADSKGDPIDDADCEVNILYPDKTYFLIDAGLEASSTTGNYYREFTTPAITGIYEETITCTFPGNNKVVKVSSSFHVSVALNFIIELSQREREHYDELVRMINDTYEQLLQQFNTSAANFEVINDTINAEFSGLSTSIQTEFGRVSGLINDTNQDFYDDMENFGSALVSIFGNESE